MIFSLYFVNVGTDLIGSVPLCSLKGLQALHPPLPPCLVGLGKLSGWGPGRGRGGEGRPEEVGLTAGSLKAATPAGLGGSETELGGAGRGLL